MSPVICFVAVLVLVICIVPLVHKWRNPKCKGLLPPGSMGWPLLGETLHFFASTSTFEINPFIKERIKRYGPVFRTSLIGRPFIVSADSDLNYYIFQQEGKLFESWYPDTFNEIFGKQNMGSLQGLMHKYLKNMVLTLFGPEGLKKIVSEVEQAANTYLKRWSTRNSVDLKDATATLIFDLTSKKLISYDPEKWPRSLRNHFVAFIQGLISFPLNIPGTAYHKCLEGRKKAMEMLKAMLQERRLNPRRQQSDFFDFVLQEIGRENTVLTDAIALDLIFLLLFASYETTSTALTLAVKFLLEHPMALKELTEEHEAIIGKRENPDSSLTWTEFKSMTFTFQVIHETLRLANIAPGIFRKALKDVDFKGFTIPAGWAVMACPPAVHLDPTRYQDPLEFDPWRWKGIDMNRATRNFMAFGGGMRFCIGADFARLQMAVFLHSFLTKYKGQAIKGGGIMRSPGLQFPNGFHVQFSEKDKTVGMYI